MENCSHDKLNRYLTEEKITPNLLWQNVQGEVEKYLEATLIFDDTVIDKRYSQSIELVRKQYSGNEHRVLRGIGLISCIYVNPKTGKYWVIDYRVYDPDGDGKTKLDHVADMLKQVLYQKNLPFKRVLMDSWYAAQKLMMLIEVLGKFYYCPLKRNRLVDDTGGQEKYQRIDQLTWNKHEKEKGKLIKIRKFPADKKVKLFRVTLSTERTEYLATNENHSSSTEKVKKICRLRWKIEEFHREVKQVTGLEACQARKARIQRNHIACAILVWNFLKKVANSTAQTVYQLKAGLLHNYLSQELKKPSLCFKQVLSSNAISGVFA